MDTSPIDLNDYYSAGYFVLRASKPPDWARLQPPLFPEKLISLYFCTRLSIIWGWIPGDRQAALDFGIPENIVDEFLAWCNSGQKDLDVFTMFHSVEAAQRFIDRFVPDRTDLKIIGAGLPKALETTSWQKVEHGNSGVETQLQKHLPLEPGGEFLGFEIISYKYNDFGFSWICTIEPADMQELYGTRPNQYGLFNTYDEAKQVDDWIAQHPKDVEPDEPYYFWLLLSYPLNK